MLFDVVFRLNHVVTPLWNQPYSKQMEVSEHNIRL